MTTAPQTYTVKYYGEDGELVATARVLALGIHHASEAIAAGHDGVKWEAPQPATRKTPDMTGKAAEITDPLALFARIGYRTYLAWRDGADSPPLYGGFNQAEMRRVHELMTGQVTP